MRSFLKYILIVLLVFIPCALSAAEYSLADLYRRALEKSETIKVAEEELYISENQKDRAIAVLMPTISAFGGHTRYTEEREAGSALIQPDHSNQWGLRLDQSFSLSGRELTAFRAAKEGIKKSRFDLHAVKEQYLLDVASSFYNVLKLKKARDIAGANETRLERHRDAAKTRLRVGDATRTSLLRAEAELAGAQSDMIRAVNDLRAAKAALAKLVGITGEYKLSGHALELMQDSAIDECEISQLECLKQKALGRRVEIKSMTLQKKIAEENVTYAEGFFWPDLLVEGVYLRRESEPDIFMELDESVYAGVKLNFPFFEGGLRRAEVRQAKARQRQAEYGLSELKKSVLLDVENSYLDLMTVSAVLEKLEAEKTYALDNFEGVTKQFEHGLADTIDVIDANTLFVTAEQKLSNAGYDYSITLLKLRRASGAFLESIVNTAMQ